MGESSRDALRVHFDARVRLEFRGATITSGARLLACRDMEAELSCRSVGALPLGRAPCFRALTPRNASYRLIPDPHPGDMGKEAAMQPATREEAYKRLSYIEGHLAGIRRMIEDDKYCADVLKQTYAVRRAIEKMEALLLDGHLHNCVVEGIRDGHEDQVIGELLELYELANK